MLQKFLGMVLFILGTYLLGKNIVITTSYIRPVWGDVLTVIALISLMVGIISLLFFYSTVGGVGWIFIGIGLVSFLFVGRLIIRPTTIWYFLFSFASLTAGLKLLTTRGRIRF
ncbi:MAG: hypothetical protein JJU32_18685 [Phormidium sp. BM_Day4_Bin.17]|nr:hypothetical protein [Phormidium sp. BM_Day4_Bin.17]UCJ13798.1 MAG: hypothetical protein JWS08_08725 [Phormidium sp. PBR-2020]